MDANPVLLCRMAELEALVWAVGGSSGSHLPTLSLDVYQGVVSRPPVLAQCLQPFSLRSCAVQWGVGGILPVGSIKCADYGYNLASKVHVGVGRH